jgi:sulfate transport system substrate-binding protein
MRKLLLSAALLSASAVLLGTSGPAHAAQTLLNVSYSPTTQLYEQINPQFEAYWKAKTGQSVTIQMSHGGSGEQARAVINGLAADVVTLGVASDIDALHDKANLLPVNWQARLPNDSTPYTSTVVFLVRQGNPKHLVDWDDLIRPGVKVITPNPKTSAGGQWNFLAAYAYALEHARADPNAARTFVKALYQHVPILNTSARGATVAFTREGIGDVLLAWENEAFLAIKEAGPGKFQIVVPSISMLAQPPVAVVDRNVQRDGTAALAEAYLRWLYTPAAQEIIAENFYRPTDPQVALRHSREFPRVNRVNISAFGGWRKAEADFFADGALFDQLYH